MKCVLCATPFFCGIISLVNHQSGNCRRGRFCGWHPEGPHAQKQSMRDAGLPDVSLFLLFLHFLQKIKKLLYLDNLSYNSIILPSTATSKKSSTFNSVYIFVVILNVDIHNCTHIIFILNILCVKKFFWQTVKGLWQDIGFKKLL